MLIADRAARTPAGLKLIVELAETLQAPVIDQGGRMNFPTRHPLNHTDRSRPLVAGADVILGLELTDFWGTVNSFRDQAQRSSQLLTKSGAKLISITAGDLYTKSNYQDFQRYPEVDLAIAADAEATLPSLIEAVKKLLTADRKRALEARGAKLQTAHNDMLERARLEASYAWDASPISTARLSAEIWAQVKNDDWALVSDCTFASRWPLRLWDFDKHYQFLGASGGGGEGYGAPASVGAALAHRKHGRLSVAIQRDGDLMYAPGVLWTAAHHRIPLLSVMHNNRAYHQEVMHLQRMTNRHQRGIDRAGIGCMLEDPFIDYAKVAQGMGVHAEGPITDPKDLGPAIQTSRGDCSARRTRFGRCSDATEIDVGQPVLLAALYPRRRQPARPAAPRYCRRLTLSGLGKSAGTFCVTFPVAAHSAPRCRVTINPTHCMATGSCPKVVWKMRPLPY